MTDAEREQLVLMKLRLGCCDCRSLADLVVTMIRRGYVGPFLLSSWERHLETKHGPSQAD